MMTGLLKSNDKPAGWGLVEVLRQLRLEIEGRTLTLAADGDPAAPRYKKIAANLLIAEAEEEGSARPLRLVRGGEREGLELVR